MIQRILKIEFGILFFLALISTFYFFFNQYLPDNSLYISSQSDDYYSLIYHLSSILAEISFYVGPWIFAPFIIFAFTYSFILSRRNREIDIIYPLALIFFFYCISFLLFPTYMGKGLYYLSDELFPRYLAYLSALVFAVFNCYLILGKQFFKILKAFRLFLERIGHYGIKKIFQVTHQSSKYLLQYTVKVGESDLSKKTVKLLKDAPSTMKKGSFKEGTKKEERKVDEIKANEVPTLTPIVKEEKVDDSVDNNDAEKEPKVERTKKEATAFFNSSDLIDCIAANISHEQVKGPDENYFSTIISAIEDKLAEFKLDGKIINILKGPVVDTFELELGSGVKVSKVTGLSDDIGLALNGAPIRIVYPMRGKSTIGIEVPRNPRDFIFLDEVLQSEPFNDSEQRLPIAMGKDAFGDVKVVDLAGMPHMLVAGATGAGKSVFINSLLVSLIIKKSPRQLKLILIDPKQLELAIFSDLPHLMLPVITDPTSSAVSLLWAVQEMEKRYTILKDMGVKNIEGFNKKVKTCDQSVLFKINPYYEDKEDAGYELPYIVIVIDEFADLILSKAGKEIENNVNRLAAKARAAGIHLVVATQRPSTDVVTGVVKANFPTRVAFRVSTGHDSKTILDQYGAEKLLGKGDMLYKHGVDLLRMHSSFVEEAEVEGLVEKLGSIDSSYDSSALDFLENGGEELEDELTPSQGSYTSGTTDDPVYQQALEVVMESGSASASMLQRRLRVGYNRAANLVEEMERNGIVGPAQGSKPRKVLVRPE